MHPIRMKWILIMVVGFLWLNWNIVVVIFAVFFSFLQFQNHSLYTHDHYHYCSHQSINLTHFFFLVHFIIIFINQYSRGNRDWDDGYTVHPQHLSLYYVPKQEKVKNQLTTMMRIRMMVKRHHQPSKGSSAQRPKNIYNWCMKKRV